MREVSLDEAEGELPVFTFLNYGDTRAGKTQLLSTFPRPYIIADATEHGHDTIKRMDRSLWFEEDVKPIVVLIESMNEFGKALEAVKPLIATKQVLTIGIDAFSFYCDFYLNGIVQAQQKPDMRQAYGALGMHLRDVRVRTHSMGVNVVWNCLARHPEADDPKGRPMIPGQQADKFAAGVDFLVYSRAEPIKEGGKVVASRHEVRTRPYGQYIAGNRLGASAELLPDPFTGTYADLITHLGYDPELIRQKLPKITGPRKLALGSTVVPVAAKPAAVPVKTIPVKPASVPVTKPAITVKPATT